MSRFRVLLAAVLVTGAVPLAATADAAVRKPCQAVKDKSGDAGIANNAAGEPLADTSLDITSLDVASNGTTLTAVIRVKKLIESSDHAPTGREWTFAFNAGTTPVGLDAFLTPLGGQGFSTGKGKFDFAKNEIRIHAAVADLADGKIKKGTVLRNLSASSAAYVGYPSAASAIGHGYAPVGGSADGASSTTASYKVGALNCVTVGK